MTGTIITRAVTQVQALQSPRQIWADWAGWCAGQALLVVEAQCTEATAAAATYAAALATRAATYAALGANAAANAATYAALAAHAAHRAGLGVDVICARLWQLATQCPEDEAWAWYVANVLSGDCA